MSQTGLVVKEQSGFFWVELADGRVVICRLRGRLMEAAQSSDIAAIGDQVTIEIADDGSGAIEAIAERTTALSRSARTEGNRGAGQAEREQVIIANADQALFVFASAQPPPSFRNIDRFLVAGEKAGIEQIVLVLNKIDLVPDDDPTRRAFAHYGNIGYTILETSVVTHIGIDALRERLHGHISVFAGPSGVGKSSLLNAVQADLSRSVGSVSRVSQEGMHTTRDSQLVRLAGGGYIADTPGLRSLAMWDTEPEELDAYYREIAPYVPQCRFNDCTHRDEPGCAVRRAVERGKISRARYDSYLSLRAELEAAYA